MSQTSSTSPLRYVRKRNSCTFTAMQCKINKPYKIDSQTVSGKQSLAALRRVEKRRRRVCLVISTVLQALRYENGSNTCAASARAPSLSPSFAIPPAPVRQSRAQALRQASRQAHAPVQTRRTYSYGPRNWRQVPLLHTLRTGWNCCPRHSTLSSGLQLSPSSTNRTQRPVVVPRPDSPTFSKQKRPSAQASSCTCPKASSETHDWPGC